MLCINESDGNEATSLMLLTHDICHRFKLTNPLKPRLILWGLKPAAGNLEALSVLQLFNHDEREDFIELEVFDNMVVVVTQAVPAGLIRSLI